MIKINQKIHGYSVRCTPIEDNTSKSNIVQMHEKLMRPDTLTGSTYKIRVPTSEHALYVTINDIVLNAGSDHESRRPFEIFINSKNMDHFQWIVALTRIMSAVFRKGGDITFMVEELGCVFDPRGGYFKSGGRFVPSLLAEIGEVLETHLKSIGLIVDQPDAAREAELASKRAEQASAQHDAIGARDGLPANAAVCGKCYARAVVRLDGCKTCLSCGDSICG